MTRRGSAGPRPGASRPSAGRPLEGRVALVTGASRGIGRAVARRLATDGALVAVTARDRGSLAGTLDEIAAAGTAGLAVDLEVRDTESMRRAVDAVEAGLGPIEVLVNNAGVQRLRPALELTEEDWDFVLDANLRGAFFMAQAVGRGMVARGYGRIINVASLSAFKALPERAAYNASKAGLLAVTRSLAVEWGPFGVTANAVAPTFVETELAGLWLNRPGVREALVVASPIRRLPTVDEVAAAVAFLASPESGAINGTVLGVDGGLGAA